MLTAVCWVDETVELSEHYWVALSVIQRVGTWAVWSDSQSAGQRAVAMVVSSADVTVGD